MGVTVLEIAEGVASIPPPLVKGVDTKRLGKGRGKGRRKGRGKGKVKTEFFKKGVCFLFGSYIIYFKYQVSVFKPKVPFEYKCNFYRMR